jgi:hypothetical protein
MIDRDGHHIKCLQLNYNLATAIISQLGHCSRQTKTALKNSFETLKEGINEAAINR